MRETGLADDVEPTGAQGVSLSAGRSIAVDRKLHVYGTPFFISAELPIESERPQTPFRRLMVGQDTGSAIIGLARADIYFGAGDEAGTISGRIKQQGRFVMLVPRSLDPGVKVLMPPPRPRHPDDPVLVATAASGVFNVRDGSAKESSGRLAYAPANAPVTVPVRRPADTEAGSQRMVVPLPPPRPAPAITTDRPQEPGRIPDWLASVVSISSAAAAPLAPARTRTFASVESAITEAASAPAAFAAPAVTQAAEIAPILQKMSKTTGVPLPRSRPPGNARIWR
jgi:hypothetical protein